MSFEEQDKDDHPNPDIFEEEDWSSLLSGTNTNNTLLSSSCYEEILIPLSPTRSLKLKCLTDRQLSPLNIVHSYSNPDHDATGHHVWSASYFFLHAMIRPLPYITTTPSSSETTWQTITELHEARIKLFSKKRVLELGCGTGIAGLALMASHNPRISRVTNGLVLDGSESDDTTNMNPKALNLDVPLPNELFLTDADPDALHLCQLNCEMNHLSTNTSHSNIFVRPLEWGNTNHWDQVSELEDSNYGDEDIQDPSLVKGTLGKGSFDTVFAADVVYDLKALSPLMTTSFEALLPNGYFLLSHIPRFASSSVEHLIMHCGQEMGFSLMRVWRPSEVYNVSETKKDMDSLERMEECNAVIFLFQK